MAHCGGFATHCNGMHNPSHSFGVGLGLNRAELGYGRACTAYVDRTLGAMRPTLEFRPQGVPLVLCFRRF